MKFRLDFVTNSSTSSFYAYSINDEKVRNYIERTKISLKSCFDQKTEEELTEIEKLLGASYDSKKDALNSLGYLNKQYKLDLSKEDILKTEISDNYGEFTQILVDEYGINVSSYVETIFHDSTQRRDEIELTSDIAIIEDAQDDKVAKENIKRFVDNYGFCQASSEVVTAYYLVFQSKGKTSEDITAMLDEYAVLLKD